MKNTQLKNYIVDFHYPTIYSFNVKATDPKEAIRLATEANLKNIENYKDDLVEERPGSRETDFESTPETFIYASEHDYYTRPMLSITPDKKTLENAVKRIIEYAQMLPNSYDQLHFLIGELNLEPELLKYYGYTQEELNGYLDNPPHHLHPAEQRQCTFQHHA